jgi:hypothetical protein
MKNWEKRRFHHSDFFLLHFTLLFQIVAAIMTRVSSKEEDFSRRGTEARSKDTSTDFADCTDFSSESAEFCGICGRSGFSLRLGVLAVDVASDFFAMPEIMQRLARRQFGGWGEHPMASGDRLCS